MNKGFSSDEKFLVHMNDDNEKVLLKTFQLIGYILLQIYSFYMVNDSF